MAIDTAHGHPDIPFEKRYERALADDQLSRNLTTFQQSWKQSREATMDEIDFEVLRSRMKVVKSRTIDNIDDYLQQFIEAARRAGTRIHLAADADEAERKAYELFDAARD